MAFGGDVTRHKSATGKIMGAIVVIVIVAVAAWWYFTRVPGVDFTRHGPEPSGPAAASTAPPPPPEHPISEAQTHPASATTAPLPPLDASDDVVAKALASIPGAEGLSELQLAVHLVLHIVPEKMILSKTYTNITTYVLAIPKHEN